MGWAAGFFELDLLFFEGLRFFAGLFFAGLFFAGLFPRDGLLFGLAALVGLFRGLAVLETMMIL